MDILHSPSSPKIHLGICGPIATADIKSYLSGNVDDLPHGYAGAPLLASLIGEYLRLGYSVSAFTLSNDLPAKLNSTVVATGKNFKIYYCSMRKRAWFPNGFLPGRTLDLFRFECNALQQAIEDASPDVVHAHWAYEFALAALATGLPHVVTCHDSPYQIARMYSWGHPTRSLYRWLRVLMARRVLRESKFVTAVSPYILDEVQPITQASIEVVPNPVDNRALALGQIRQAPTNPRLAMVCNGWGRLKNPEPALIAFDRLRKCRAEAELHLFGHDFGPGEKAEMWCAERSINGVVFHGALPHYQLLESLAGCDLLLHPSLEESFGMVLAEAMAMGLPVVAGTRSGAVPWVVGEQGVLCDVTNPAAIEQALLKALMPANYAVYSSQGVEVVRDRFSAASVAEQYLALYGKALMQQNALHAAIPVVEVKVP